MKNFTLARFASAALCVTMASDAAAETGGGAGPAATDPKPGDAVQVTDAMKRSIIWAMDEHERRRGRTLRRTYHGALKSTDCPGPALTAWARAGNPAPTTTIQEEDMPLTENDFARIDQIIQSRAGWTGAGWTEAAGAGCLAGCAKQTSYLPSAPCSSNASASPSSGDPT